MKRQEYLQAVKAETKEEVSISQYLQDILISAEMQFVSTERNDLCFHVSDQIYDIFHQEIQQYLVKPNDQPIKFCMINGIAILAKDVTPDHVRLYHKLDKPASFVPYPKGGYKEDLTQRCLPYKIEIIKKYKILPKAPNPIKDRKHLLIDRIKEYKLEMKLLQRIQDHNWQGEQTYFCAEHLFNILLSKEVIQQASAYRKANSRLKELVRMRKRDVEEFQFLDAL